MKTGIASCFAALLILSCTPAGPGGRDAGPSDAAGRLVAYCESKNGSRVGNGECWTLADEAFKACGLARPGKSPRVWGRSIPLKTGAARPGDIVEFRRAKFKDGSFTGPEHTAIIVKTHEDGVWTVAEQNWNNVKKARYRKMNPAGLESGELMIYRPGKSGR